MYKISLITGDGIGPEISDSVNSVLEAIHDNLDIKFDIKKLEAGDTALKNSGHALPDDVIKSIKNCWELDPELYNLASIRSASFPLAIVQVCST